MSARVLLLCVWLVFAVVPLRAQLPPHDDPMGDLLIPPELLMRHQQALGLQPEQKTYVRDELRKAQLRFTELQWQLQDAMETMRTLLEQSPAPEAQVLAQLDKVLEAEREIKRTQIALMVRIKNKLTPEQQARLLELRLAAPPPPHTPPGVPGPPPQRPPGPPPRPTEP